MSITILTGPVASGKNTVSKILAQKKERCAVIDVDMLRQMYVQPHKAPWDGEEGKSQQMLGVENACLLAKSFAKSNIDVVILDVITDETANVYKKNLGEVKIILLMPSYEETQKRFNERPPTISEQEFKMIYQWEESLTVFDEKIDNTALSEEETADKISVIN
jgi:guanylate kinase